MQVINLGGPSDVTAKSVLIAAVLPCLDVLEGFVQKKLTYIARNYTSVMCVVYALQLVMLAWNECT